MIYLYLLKVRQMDLAIGARVLLASPDKFLAVKETLERIGVTSKDGRTLYQSCHILHKRGHYAIVHFKELLDLDGLSVDITESDIGRRNLIAALLDQWGLVTLVNRDQVADPVVPISAIKIVPFKQRNDYVLVPKYNIGQR